ncbi:hypothetical protein CR513_35418, partial [Mucuna pruriens]
MSPYQIMFGKACHLSAEIKHKAYWVVKKCNMAYDQAEKERTLYLEAYENSRIYKQKVKQFHDNQILRKEFKVSQKVFLFHSRLKLITDKLCSRWDGPLVITNVFPYGAVEVRDEGSTPTKAFLITSPHHHFNNIANQTNKEGTSQEPSSELKWLIEIEDKIILPYQEETETINIGFKGEMKEVKVGILMCSDNKRKLIQLLTERVDIFAWAY